MFPRWEQDWMKHLQLEKELCHIIRCMNLFPTCDKRITIMKQREGRTLKILIYKNSKFHKMYIQNLRSDNTYLNHNLKKK